MSPKAAGLAVKMGFTNIRVMLEGFPGWEKTGRSLVAANKFVQSGNIVLVDVRSREEAAAGHIPRAVNISLERLENALDQFPSSKSAPIVVYGNGDDASTARKTIKEWGFKSVSLVDGGIAGWQKAGNKLVVGPAADQIKWVRKLGKGEVAKAEFAKVIQGSKKDAVILDVRTNDEAGAGKFPGAVHIPLDELESRLEELPGDKELLIHCTTGARAEMAHQVLLNHQVRNRFLVADVECENGKCELEED